MAFATWHGEAAYDGREENSPYTAAFLKHVQRSELDVDALFKMIRDDVIAATKSMQQPEIRAQRGAKPYFLGRFDPGAVKQSSQ